MIRIKNILKNLTLLFVTTTSLFLSTNCKSKDLGSYKYPNANVILILIDTLRADHLGCYGYHRNTSPVIDKLAQDGIIFKNMLAQTSWTRPGTASILSGLYPKNHGANTGDDSLAEEVTLLSEILKRVGYTSYAFVANSNVGREAGFDQGYRDFFFFREHISKAKLSVQTKSDEVNKHVLKLIEQLQKQAGNFIYIHYMDPHAPYIPKEKHFSKSDKTVFSSHFIRSEKILKMPEEQKNRVLKEMINAYDDEVLFNDKMVGKLVRALKKKKMYSNSIVIITSDHGEEFLEHGGITHGKTLYDEQLRVPLIIRLPDRVRKEIFRTANQVDISPTLLSLLNIPIPQNIDGIDLLNEKKPLRQYSFAELIKGIKVISSIQSPGHKIIESVSTPTKDKFDSRWFSKNAVLKTGEDSLELIVQSLYQEGSIRVLSDGKPVEKLMIKPKKQVFDVVLPKTNKEKRVTIRSLFPCRVPAELGINNDPRCLAFRIFDSKNIDDKNILGEFYEEFYLVQDDPGETKNYIRRKRFRRLIMELKKKLRKYKADKRNLRLNKKPVIFDEEQLKALEALGYI